jgi:MFS family permease
MVNSVTLRIVHTSLFTFFCYLVIGLLLAVLPGFVHLRLGLSPLWAGVAVSSQYVATLLTRPEAGRMTDVSGPRATVLLGQLACLLSGLFLLLAGSLQNMTMVCFGVLVFSRLILGCGESCVATGSTTWGLGRVDPEYEVQVISWSGIASYGAMAAGAPLGIWLENRHGIEAIGAAVAGISLLGLAFAVPLAGVPVLRGAHLRFPKLLRGVILHGLGLAFGTVGFGTIASFTTLFYASRHWSSPALALGVFGSCFVATRLLLGGTINDWGGFRVAMVSFIVEGVGLLLLSSAAVPEMALAGTALSGCGFALVFPALGVEAVKTVAEQDRGSVLGVYTAFLDLAMGVTGPIAGFIIGEFGYSAIFLYGAGAATCAFVVTLFLYHVVRKRHLRGFPRTAGLVENARP